LIAVLAIFQSFDALGLQLPFQIQLSEEKESKNYKIYKLLNCMIGI
jgi:hypothetical protein